MANTPYIDLVKPAGTDKALISVLNANSDKIDSAVGGVQDALAIVCNGNTHGAITSGQFVYVRAHDTLQEGLYTANSNIAANATLSSSNLTANSSGGLNALNEQIGTLDGVKLDKVFLGAINNETKNFTVNGNSQVEITIFGTGNNDTASKYFVATNNGGTVRVTKIGGASNVTVVANGANTLKISTTDSLYIYAAVYGGLIYA